MSSFSQITQCRWSLERKFIHELSQYTKEDPDKLRETLPFACIAKACFAAATIFDAALTTCYAGAVCLGNGIVNNDYETFFKGAGFCLGGKMLLSRSLIRFVWTPIVLGTALFHGIDVHYSPMPAAKDKVVDVWAKALFLGLNRSYSFEHLTSKDAEVADELTRMQRNVSGWERYLLKIPPYSNGKPLA